MSKKLNSEIRASPVSESQKALAIALTKPAGRMLALARLYSEAREELNREEVAAIGIQLRIVKEAADVSNEALVGERHEELMSKLNETQMIIQGNRVGSGATNYTAEQMASLPRRHDAGIRKVESKPKQ